jgi:methyl-accepting chemotaxis protein
MNKKWFHVGIFQKILITMLVVAIVPLSAIWYIDYRNSIERISNTTDQQLADISDKLVSQVNDWITMNLKVLNQNAALAEMISMDGRKQSPILRSILSEYKWSYLVHAIGANGMNTGRSDDQKPIDYSDRVYFKQAMSGAPMGSQVVISKTTGKPSLLIAVPVYATDKAGGKNVIGALSMGMSIAEMSERITNLRIGKTGYAFLLDENGKVIAHQKEEYAATSADFSKRPAFQNRPPSGKKKMIYDDENGKKVIAYVQTTQQGWLMVAQEDYDEIYAPIQEANNEALILLGVTLFIVLLIAYLLSQRLSSPIRNLTRVADEMSRGRVVARITEVGRGDEIGALAGAIDRMGTSIRLAIEKLSAKA